MAEDTLSPVLDPARVARRNAVRRKRRIRRVAGASATVAVLAVGGNALARRGEVAPSVVVAGVDIGGLSHEDAAAHLRAVLKERLERPIDVRVGARTVKVVPAKVGVKVNVEATVRRALDTGRLRASLLPFVGSDTVRPVYVLPREPALPATLAALEHDPEDAVPSVTSDGKVTVSPAATGLAIAARPALTAIAIAAVRGDTSVNVTPKITDPKVSTTAARAVAADARLMLSKPVQLLLGKKHIGAVSPSQLAPTLRVVRKGDRFTIAVDAKRLRTAMAAAVEPYLKPPVNATWTTNGKTASVVPAKDGIDVVTEPTAAAVRSAALKSGLRRAKVTFGTREAALTTKRAQALGIRSVVSSVTTDLGDSSENRIHNVQLMADILDGHVIMPGATFSFNDVVGPRDADRGFLEGQAIVNGLLVPSIGGGVCQVATTVFGAAFYDGLTITNRTNHSFYISHYDLGMDATVSWGGPDLVFTNNTDKAILIRTAADASTMTVNFYSSPRGVEVTKTTSEKTNFTDPKPRYVLDPKLPPKAIQQSTSGLGGFDVTVSRTVTQHGKVVKQDSFGSTYVPEDIIYRVGKDAKIPAGFTVEPAPPDEG